MLRSALRCQMPRIWEAAVVVVTNCGAFFSSVALKSGVNELYRLSCSFAAEVVVTLLSSAESARGEVEGLTSGRRVAESLPSCFSARSSFPCPLNGGYCREGTARAAAGAGPCVSEGQAVGGLCPRPRSGGERSCLLLCLLVVGNTLLPPS